MKQKRYTVPGTACLLLAVFFLMPLAAGILHIGMLWPAALLLLAASVCFWPRWPLALPRWLRHTAAVCIGMGLTAALVVLILMAAAARNHPAADAPPRTVIVLGCEVRPDGHPSVMLQSRIDAAYAYLSHHPDAVCVASGGLDDDEQITEARCIRDTLVAMGIAPERIYLEEASGSTYENLTFSAAVIADNGLDTRVALATDNFHEYRGQFFARRAGLDPCSIGCTSYWILGPGYWAREVLGVLAAWVRGY